MEQCEFQYGYPLIRERCSVEQNLTMIPVGSSFNPFYFRKQVAAFRVFCVQEKC